MRPTSVARPPQSVRPQSALKITYFACYSILYCTCFSSTRWYQLLFCYHTQTIKLSRRCSTIRSKVSTCHAHRHKRCGRKMSDSSTALLSSVPDKVILVGDVGVGKTSIFSRFKTGNFEYRGKEAEMQKSWTINDQTVTVSDSRIFSSRVS